MPNYDVNITINLNYDTIDLVGYDSSTKTATFSVTTEDGTNFHLILKGEAKYSFVGHNYIDPAKLESWPDELLLMCFDGANRFYNQIHGFESEEVISYSEVGNEILENFDEEMTALNLLLSSSCKFSYQGTNEDLQRKPLSDADQELLKEALNILLGSDLYFSESPTNIDEAWDAIYDLLKDSSDSSQNAIYGSLVYMIAKYDSANYANIFTENMVSHLTEALTIFEYKSDTEGDRKNETSLDAFSKAMLYIHQEMTGVDLGSEFSSTAESHEMILALNFIDNHIPDLTVASELALAEENAELNATVDFRSFQDQYNSYIRTVMEATDNSCENYYEEQGIDENTLYEYVYELGETLSEMTDSGKTSAEEMRTVIYDYLDGMPNYYGDDVTAIFVYLVSRLDFPFFENLCANEQWAKDIWALMDNGDYEPSTLNELREAFERAGVIV